MRISLKCAHQCAHWQRAISFIAASALLAGCTASIKDQTRTQYLNATFSAENIREGGVALFPVTAGQGQEGYRRPLGDCLNDSLQYAVPGGAILTWQATMDSLNQHGKVDTYQQVIDAYSRTSILDREKVKGLSGAVHTRYAIFCALQRFDTSKGGYNFWTGTSGTVTNDVMAHCLIVDLHTGDVMQEIVGEATSMGDPAVYKNLSYEAHAQVLAQSVLSQIPGSSVSPPGPPKTDANKKTLRSR